MARFWLSSATLPLLLHRLLPLRLLRLPQLLQHPLLLLQHPLLLRLHPLHPQLLQLLQLPLHLPLRQLLRAKHT